MLHTKAVGKSRDSAVPYGRPELLLAVNAYVFIWIRNMQKLCGWVGKILKVDLTHEQIEILDTMAYAEKFLGGLGIGQKLYWDHAAWGADAFDERQPLIFMTGPLAATPAPSAPRLSICGKSPCIYPETFVSASLGGFFAPELKKAGFDGIIVVGRADGAVHIHIEDGNVEIREAVAALGPGESYNPRAFEK